MHIGAVPICVTTYLPTPLSQPCVLGAIVCTAAYNTAYPEKPKFFC